MSFRYGEAIADDLSGELATRKPARERVDAETRRRASTVCKHMVPPATPGAISTFCQNEPVTPLGYCAAHFPK